jgi:diacylglycerol kinase family enzyme
MARLCVSVMLGHWKQNPQLTERTVEALTLHFPRRKSSAQAVIDGELIRLPRQVALRSHPGALQVVLPRVEARAVA